MSRSASRDRDDIDVAEMRKALATGSGKDAATVTSARQFSPFSDPRA